MEEEKGPQRRQSSADNMIFRNQLFDDKKSQILDQQYGSRKKVMVEDENKEDIMDQCMMSQPNKMTLE